MIEIAEGVVLPDEVVTEVTGILARRSAGKTYTAKKIAEQVIKARLPIVIIDPLGAFWGLRSSVDGLSDGLPVVIFGGAHADVPLTSDVGKEIATVVVDNPGAYIVDLSHFDTKGEEITFMTAFLERLYRYKAQHPSALLLIIDEADTFAPQRPDPRETKMLGSMESIVRRGRLRGLGVILITQRAAVLNKNVLTQVELLVLLQTTSPQDRKAVEEWIKAKSADDQRKEVMDSLGSLQRGEAWLWSPAWLQILQRVQISAQETFDSSKTPKPGEAIIEPEVWAAVDIEALGAKIAATKARADQDDPVVLRRHIAELEQQAAHFERELASVSSQMVTEVQIKEVPVFADGELERVEALVDRMTHISGSWAQTAVVIEQLATKVATVAGELRDVFGDTREPFGPAPAEAAAIMREFRGPTREQEYRHDEPVPIAAVTRTTETPKGLDIEAEQAPIGRAGRAFLAALAQFPDGLSFNRAAFLAGYAPTVSTTRNTLSNLRSRGLVKGSGRGDDLLRITQTGLETLGPFEPAPTGRELIDYWRAKLGKAQQSFFLAVAGEHPRPISQDEAAAIAGYDPKVSTTRNTVSSLRSLGLIAGGSNSLALSPDLAGD